MPAGSAATSISSRAAVISTSPPAAGPMPANCSAAVAPVAAPSTSLAV